jgi:hypothetical protein
LLTDALFLPAAVDELYADAAEDRPMLQAGLVAAGVPAGVAVRIARAAGMLLSCQRLASERWSL